MSIICEKYANVKPLENFDWTPYENGWNGTGLVPNKKVKTKNGIKVYCHEGYAQSLYNKFSRQKGDDITTAKDLREGDVIQIKDVTLLNNDELLLSTASGGSAIVNLSKENKFYELHGRDKDFFKNEIFGTEDGREIFLKGNYLAKIEKNGKASLYEGNLVKTELEFKEQLAKEKSGDNKTVRAYSGKIVGSNRGGFIVDIRGVRCFMPGSHATSNKIIDFDSLVGTETMVMLMNYIEGKGFLVSRKKYLKHIENDMFKELREDFEKNPDKVYRGTITGAKHFGIFVELNEHYTGLLHKTYIMPTDYELLKGTEEEPDTNARKNFPPGTEISVKIYSISEDENRIILTNIMDKETRDTIVEARIKEEEKIEQQRREEEKRQKELHEIAEKKQLVNRTAKTFKGEIVSLEDLANL